MNIFSEKQEGPHVDVLIDASNDVTPHLHTVSYQAPGGPLRD